MTHQRKGLSEAALSNQNKGEMVSAGQKSAGTGKCQLWLEALKALTAASQGKIGFSITHPASQHW